MCFCLLSTPLILYAAPIQVPHTKLPLSIILVVLFRSSQQISQATAIWRGTDTSWGGRQLRGHGAGDADSTSLGSQNLGQVRSGAGERAGRFCSWTGLAVGVAGDLGCRIKASVQTQRAALHRGKNTFYISFLLLGR